MDRLNRVIEQYGRWIDLKIYIERINAYVLTDYSQALENAKALLETIGKEICNSKGIKLDSTASINLILKKAFSAIGHSSESMVTQISTSLANIGQKIGELRNDIGSTSHGKSLEELKERNDKVDALTKEFLIDSVIIVSSFLIKAFEAENSRVKLDKVVTRINYTENDEFNKFWDDTFGDFEMGEYSYPASEIFYNVDYSAYVTEQKVFVENKEGDK